MDERIKLEALMYACACKAHSKERRKHDCFYLQNEDDYDAGYHFCVTEDGCIWENEHAKDDIVSDILDKMVTVEKLGDVLSMAAVVHGIDLMDLEEFAAEWKDKTTTWVVQGEE